MSSSRWSSLFAIVILWSSVGCSSLDREDHPASTSMESPAVEDGDVGPGTAGPHPDAVEFGITDLELRLSNHGAIVDFRYRVIDEIRASRLLDRDVKIRLIEPSTGARAIVMNSPKIGPLRNTGSPVEGRTYYMLFQNPGLTLKSGAVIDLEIGDRVLTGVILE